MSAILVLPDAGHSQVASWVVSPVAEISVGSETDPLFAVRDAMKLDGDTIAILSSGTNDVRIYAGGRLARTIGRTGQGPGEFLAPSSFGRMPSGGTVVFDRGTSRITALAQDWSVSETLSLPEWIVGGAPRTRYALRTRPSPAGVFRAYVDISMRDRVQRHEGVYAADDVVVEWVSDGTAKEVLRVERGPYYVIRDGGRGFSQPLPLAPQALLTSTHDLLVVGNSHRASIKVYDRGGREIWSVRAEGEPRTPTADEWEAFEARFLRRFDGELSVGGATSNSESLARRFLMEAPRGELAPIFDRVAIDLEGRIWIREFAPSRSRAEWQVLGRRGVIARVSTPGDWEMVEIGLDYLLVLERGEHDQEFVSMYRMSGGGRSHE